MSPTKPYALLHRIQAAMLAKGLDTTEARLEVAQSVAEALALAQQVCLTCGAEAYAEASTALHCGRCRIALAPPTY
jgi:protein-disulfide isomerase-like protein with CxxC motif